MRAPHTAARARDASTVARGVLVAPDASFSIETPARVVVEARRRRNRRR
jgi:hypothetical protein